MWGAMMGCLVGVTCAAPSWLTLRFLGGKLFSSVGVAGVGAGGEFVVELAVAS